MPISLSMNANMLQPSVSSLYSKATVGFLGVAVFFHSVGVFTESWCQSSWSGQRLSLGLWRGCLEKASKQWICSRKYNRATVFGISWGFWSQVLISLALALLLLIELLALGYTCVPKLTSYRLKLLEVTAGLCILTGVLTVVGLILLASEVNQYPPESNARITWSFGMCVLSLLFLFTTTALVFLDKKLESSSLSYRRQSISLEPTSGHNRY